MHAMPTRSEIVLHAQQAFKLALSLVLFYWVALTTNWDLPRYGGLAIVIVSLGTTGASIKQGLLRIVGTTFGVLAGVLIVSLFNHDRWCTLLALAAHVTLMCYGMQTSRFAYAWYAAGFIPLVVWADNYPGFDNTFYFATFRWLETTVGVLIYTMVDLVLWPRRSGDQLSPAGRELFTRMRQVFSEYRRVLESDPAHEVATTPAGGPETRAGDTSKLRSRLAGALAKAATTLQNAYFDAPEIGHRRSIWEDWHRHMQALADGLELWRETIDDCHSMHLDEVISQLSAALDTLDQRLQRVAGLWDGLWSDDPGPAADDARLMEPLPLHVDRSRAAELSASDRAAVLGFRGQLGVLDQTSGELMRTLRALAGGGREREANGGTQSRTWYRAALWDPERLVKALFPTTAIVVAWACWVLLDPPTGPKIPMMVGILGILVLRTPMNPVPLWLSMLLSMLIAVGPIYWLVMPALSSGTELLTLLFVYSFIFGFLGGWSPVLKSGPIIQFLVSTGISNQQSYSFQGLVNGSLLVLLSGVIMTVVYFLFHPLRPEQSLLSSFRRFSRGCSVFLGEFALFVPTDRSHRRRNVFRKSTIQPSASKISADLALLDRGTIPDSSRQRLQRLADSLQNIAYRLQSLEMAHARLAQHDSEAPPSLVSAGGRLRESLAGVFQQWTRLEPGSSLRDRAYELDDLRTKVIRDIDALPARAGHIPARDSVAVDFYTVLGSVRGLVNSMVDAQDVIDEIDWSYLTATRF